MLDASATIDCLLQTPAGRRIENRIYSHNESLHCPHLLDLEVTQVLRRLVREAVISVSRAQQAIEDLLDLRIHTLSSFHSSSCDLAPRHNLSAYDSAYLVLAAQLGASLITRDARLATAAAGSVSAEVF